MKQDNDALVGLRDVALEGSMLGGILTSRDTVDKAMEFLTIDSFYHNKHRDIFGAIDALHGANEPVDMVTVNKWLRDKKKLDGIGGPLALIELSNSSNVHSGNVEYYCRMLQQYEIARATDSATAKANNLIRQGGDVFEIINTLQTELIAINDRVKTKPSRDFKEIVGDALDSVAISMKNKGKITGIPSGLVALDQHLWGFQRTDLTIVAARPGMGKTLLVAGAALNGAKEGFNTLFASLEMQDMQIVKRMLAGQSGIDATKIRKGDLTPEEYLQIQIAASELVKIGNNKMFVDDTSGITLQALRNKATKIKKEHGLDMLVIDYIQLMGGDGKAQNREQEIGKMSRGLKALAKDLKIAIICLSQLSRAVESRPDKRPNLSDLRDSGQIEQDADNIIFIYRPGYYYDKDEDGNPIDEKETELIIAKFRNGSPDTVKVGFDGPKSKFFNLSDNFLPFQPLPSHTPQVPNWGKSDASSFEQEGQKPPF